MKTPEQTLEFIATATILINDYLKVPDITKAEMAIEILKYRLIKERPLPLHTLN